MNHPRLDLSWSIEIVLSFHETCENNRVTFASIARKGFPLDRRKVKVECTINKRKLNSTHFQIYAHRKRLEPPIESWKFSFHTFFFSITPLFRILINYNPLQSILAKKPVNPSNRIRETSVWAEKMLAPVKSSPFRPTWLLDPRSLPSFDIPSSFLFRTMSPRHAFVAYNSCALSRSSSSRSHLDSATNSLSLSLRGEARVYFRLILYLRIRADYCQWHDTGFGSEDTPLGMRGDKKDKRGVFVSRRCRLV